VIVPAVGVVLMVVMAMMVVVMIEIALAMHTLKFLHPLEHGLRDF
jgi:hypothetical protein